MEYEIPVKLGQRRLNEGSLFVDAPPIIEVSISHASKNNGKLYPALIDTGAEGVVISKELSVEINASILTKGTMHGFSAPQETSIINSTSIIIPSINVTFSCNPSISDLGASGNTFSLILGRSFLENCRLELHGPNKTYRLWWCNQS